MYPEELVSYPQWICWRYAITDDNKQTKLPFNPMTGKLASVSSPSHWVRFDAAHAALQTGYYNGLGFVLTDNDPFCGIDLDNAEGNPQIIHRQMGIAAAMDSYSEISPSGTGLHIWTKARIPQGRKRDKVEVYSSGRYLTVTGNTYLNKPIVDRQYLISQLWNELGDTGFPKADLAVVNQPEQFSDEHIYATARAADNGEKFDTLWRGAWQELYNSQSEADFALINILGFYSRNVEQIRRMFRLSALGKRDKAKRHSYVDSMIRDSFDNSIPQVPIEQLTQSVASQLAIIQDKEKAESNPFHGPLFKDIPDPEYDWTVPPGLMGEIAQFIYQASPRPIKEISLAASIALMAGICGRAYNISATGLNHYVLILAKTGSGKEAASSGIDRLMQAVKKAVPAAMDFIGPADIASGQALLKYLQKHPCFVSIVGEFGLVLKAMCSEHASAAHVTLRKSLLSLYMKSGKNEIQRQLVYSDSDKNTDILRSPAFSLLGESTPSTFYESMTETMIAQGLMPRLTVIEYAGKVPTLNKAHSTAVPSDSLILRLGELSAYCLVMAQHQRTIDVQLSTEAQDVSDDLVKKYTAKINVSELEVARELWNRAHLKILKLAALIAIGNNSIAPVIDLAAIKWAHVLVERDIVNVIEKFDSGAAGRPQSEMNQMRELTRIIGEYVKRPYFGLEKYQVLSLMHQDRVFTASYLARRIGNNAAFSYDRLGVSAAIQRCVQMLCNEGALREVRQIDINARYGKTMKAYQVMDLERFM